jgi:hypothetical protein
MKLRQIPAKADRVVQRGDRPGNVAHSRSEFPRLK